MVARQSVKQLRNDNCREISTLLKSLDLTKEIIAHGNGRLEIRSVTWAEYWRPFLCGADTSVLDPCLAWRESRAAYIESRFRLELASRYCFAYFSFLATVIERVARGNDERALLLAILSLECSPIRREEESAGYAVAATSNVRNPVYLLAKLKCPQAYDDPKFVPLIIGGASNPSAGAPHLFYYYRRFVVESRGGIALLVYPAVRVDDRAESFRCIELVTHGLVAKTDPRAARRADWIADRAIGPFLCSLWANRPEEPNAPLAIADLGGGSGQLTECIWDKLVQGHPDIVQGRDLFWHLVDLKPHNTARLIRQKKLRVALAELRCVRADWKDWILRSATSLQRFHVLLLCRLLNNFSKFSVESVYDWYQIRLLSKGQVSRLAWKNRSFMPHICLAEGGGGPSSLVASNARVRRGRLRAFVQLSLSDYFRGIQLLSRPPTASSGHDIYFAARRFDDASLLLPDGQSILAALCALSDLVVIEDVDFNAKAILRHMKTNGLSNLAASDATDRVKMQGANLLCVSERKNEGFLPGRRIW